MDYKFLIIEKKKTIYNIILIGENHTKGTSNFNKIVDLSKKNKITLSLED